MAPKKPPSRGKRAKITKSEDALNALFAKNLTRKYRRKKPLINLRELPEASLNRVFSDESSLHVLRTGLGADSTFDRIMGGPVYNAVNVTQHIKTCVSSDSEVSRAKVTSILGAHNSPIMTRSKRRLNNNRKSAKMSRRNTQKDPPKNDAIIQGELSFFSRNFHENILKNSTPLVKKIQPNPVVPDSNLSPIQNYIKSWDSDVFPLLDSTHFSYKQNSKLDWKYKASPKVYLIPLRIEEKPKETPKQPVVCLTPLEKQADLNDSSGELFSGFSPNTQNVSNFVAEQSRLLMSGYHDNCQSNHDNCHSNVIHDSSCYIADGSNSRIVISDSSCQPNDRSRNVKCDSGYYHRNAIINNRRKVNNCQEQQHCFVTKRRRSFGRNVNDDVIVNLGTPDLFSPPRKESIRHDHCYTPSRNMTEQMSNWTDDESDEVSNLTDHKSNTESNPNWTDNHSNLTDNDKAEYLRSKQSDSRKSDEADTSNRTNNKSNWSAYKSNYLENRSDCTDGILNVTGNMTDETGNMPNVTGNVSNVTGIMSNVTDDLSILPHQMTDDKNERRVTLKPGKQYRRSLVLLRRFNSGNGNQDDVESHADDCSCSTCISKRRRTTVEPYRNRQKSMFVVLPILEESSFDGTGGKTELKKYATRITSCYEPDASDEEAFLRRQTRDNNNGCINQRQESAFRNKCSSLISTPPVQSRAVNSANCHCISSSFLVAPDDVDAQSARDFVLRRCGQTAPLHFQQCYPDALLANCQKIGEGVYGEVFLYRNRARGTGTSVMKIIPIEGEKVVNGERQKRFDEILSEVVISMELSNLRKNKGDEQRTNLSTTFNEVQSIRCVQGRYPDRLLDLWQLWDETHGSENDSPDMFDEEQLYVVLELDNGGTDLEAYVFNNAAQMYSVFKQVAFALAVAESELKFEHRDLHWGNVLVRPCARNKPVVRCVLDEREVLIQTHGVEAAIIDFTLSRVECDGVVIYNDLGADEELFMAKGDYQFDVYRLMQQSNGNEWKTFNAYTNVLWLHYILGKALDSENGIKYKSTTTKIHQEYMEKLRRHHNEIMVCKSAQEFVKDNRLL